MTITSVTPGAPRASTQSQLTNEWPVIPSARGHIFWYKHAGMMKIGFYNDRKKILVAVTSDQSRILTCITKVRIDYVEDLFYTEGAGVLVDWPNCPFYWEVPNYG